ncbi:DUF3990 domain-containing protein [Enterococcus avium]|uniref:DUF3990 domain-containing protein n=1 Tax=Enterococcus avium TaxID=33945 RepID=UPI001C1DE64D|nr:MULTISPECIES: DUF3990 domain-containing protein [Enterococcus]MDT2481281.1 DUF3990 domain-containing protein [Enterococcus avium]
MELLKNETIWYHGTTTQFETTISNIEVARKRKRQKALDFGTGFYLTSNKAQAVAWAKRKASTFNRYKESKVVSVRPLVISYTIDFNKIVQKEFLINYFGNHISEEFLDFLYLNRVELLDVIKDGRYKGNLHQYSLVYGSVADGVSGDIISTLTSFKEHRDVELTKKGLAFRINGVMEDQLCICNQDVVQYIKEEGREYCEIEE